MLEGKSWRQIRPLAVDGPEASPDLSGSNLVGVPHTPTE